MNGLEDVSSQLGMSFSSPDMSLGLGILSSLLYVLTFIVGGAFGALVGVVCFRAFGTQTGFLLQLVEECPWAWQR